MTVQRLEHVGLVVDDLPAAIEFFVALGMELEGESAVEGEWAERIVGLEGMRVDVAVVRTPDGQGKLEMAQFHSPPSEDGSSDAPANARGIRHILLVVDDVDEAVARVRDHGGELIGEVVNYEDIYKLCYARGPEGIIIELVEKLG